MNPLQFLFPNFYNDKILSRQRRIHSGDLVMDKRVAIYLVFPKTGLLPSHLHSIQYMIDNGYTPLIVSNLPLTSQDLTTLRPLSHQIIERVNFGYDFGGYREAILWLGDKLLLLDRLVLLNDSTWFPLAGQMNWLSQTKSLPHDFIGALEAGFVKRPDVKSYKTMRWRMDRGQSRFHYCSFALSIRPKILQNIDFIRFWKNLRLTQGKNRTVKRGEIGLTQWVLAQGYSHSATTDYSDLDQVLLLLPEVELRRFLARVMIVQDPDAQAMFDRLAINPGWSNLSHHHITQAILMAVARRGGGHALADYLISDKNYGFLKKYAAGPNEKNMTAMVALIENLSDPLRYDMLAERGLTSSAASQTADREA